MSKRVSLDKPLDAPGKHECLAGRAWTQVVASPACEQCGLETPITKELVESRKRRGAESLYGPGRHQCYPAYEVDCGLCGETTVVTNQAHTQRATAGKPLDEPAPHFCRGKTTTRSYAGLAPLSELIARDGLMCWYCGVPVRTDVERTHPSKATRDHYLPVTKGGSNDASNLVVACFTCNCRKSNMLPEEFMAKLQAEAEAE